MRTALAVILVSLCTAASAAASGVCDPERPATIEDEARAAELEDAGVASLDVHPLAQAQDLILPCAIAESGVLGPACQDAPMYVVTHAGVVLCQVNLAVVAPGSTTPMVTGRPAVPAPHPRSCSQQPAVPSASPILPALVVGEAPRAPHAVDAVLPDVPPTPPWGPS